MTQNNPKTDAINDKKEAKTPFFDKVLGTKDVKESNISQENCEKMVKDLTESLQRLQAEFENYQKRNAKQNEEFRVYANAKLIEDLLPILDSLEQGMQHDKELVLVFEQINGILKKKGLEKIQIKKGMQFNHDEMECLMQECDSKLAEDCVVNVLMNGYKLNGKVLRAARVSVNSLPKKEETKKTEEKKEDGKKADKQEENKSEKNEYDGITKCDFKINIMESD